MPNLPTESDPPFLGSRHRSTSRTKRRPPTLSRWIDPRAWRTTCRQHSFLCRNLSETPRPGRCSYKTATCWRWSVSRLKYRRDQNPCLACCSCPSTCTWTTNTRQSSPEYLWCDDNTRGLHHFERISRADKAEMLRWTPFPRYPPSLAPRRRSAPPP